MSGGMQPCASVVQGSIAVRQTSASASADGPEGRSFVVAKASRQFFAWLSSTAVAAAAVVVFGNGLLGVFK